jgi:hypothetical protein
VSTAVPSDKSKDPRHSVSQDDFIAPVIGALPSISSLGAAYGKSRGLFGFNMHGIPSAIAVTPEEASLARSNKDVRSLIMCISMPDHVRFYSQ